MYKQIDSNKRKSAILIVGFILFIAFLGWLFGEIFAGGYFGLAVAAILAILFALVGYYSSDKIVLTLSHAHQIDKEQVPRVYNLVENLCITAGLPMPKIYIILDPSPNAFATGRNPEHASIALTSGLIQKLNRVELEGVIAHELSHAKNYDIRLATLVVVFVGIIVLFSDFMRRSFWFGGRRRSKETGQIGVILFLIAIILMILSPLIGKLIQLAISRKREFLADADGALLTRYPEGLAQALEKISQDVEPLRAATRATAHMFIISPLRGQGRGRKVTWLNRLFMTHPPVEERIKALRGTI